MTMTMIALSLHAQLTYPERQSAQALAHSSVGKLLASCRKNLYKSSVALLLFLLVCGVCGVLCVVWCVVCAVCGVWCVVCGERVLCGVRVLCVLWCGL